MKEGFLLGDNSIEIKYKIKNSIGINVIGFILTTMAGWIDTIGVRLFLNENASFMTGRGFILGYLAYKKEFKIFMSILLVIIAFIVGAFISTIITKRIGLSGGLFFTGILIILSSLPISLQNPIIASFFLPMAMGGQNASTSLTEINRTTHLTGPATDIGINIAEGNWKVVKFWIYRWIGFPFGSIMAFNLINLVNKNVVSVSVTLIIPGIIIILTGIIQKLIFDIPLLD